MAAPPPSSSAGPARALAAAVRQAAARASPSAGTEAAIAAASVRALPLASPRRRRRADDAQTAAGISISSVSALSPSSASAPAAAASSGCCRRCGGALCACACSRCGGRSFCRCGPSYGAALPVRFWRQQQQHVRGLSTSAAASSAAEAEPSKDKAGEEQRQQQQQQSEEKQQEQSEQQSEQQQPPEPQHLFSRLRDKLFGGTGDAASPNGENDESPADRAARLLRAAAREVADAVLPREERVSLTRQYDGAVWQPPAPGSATSSDNNPAATALAVAPPPPPSAAKRLLDDLRARFGAHPLFARFAAAAAQAPGSSAAAGAAGAASAAAQHAARKAQDAVDALREKYETSDHPAVHRAEEVKEKLFGATEAAEALAEAFRRDPRFDVAKLLASVKHDARTVVGAFLGHDLATLKKYAGPELLERLTGVFAHFDAQGGLREDPTILFVGDPELVEVRTVENDPMVVVQFACQQIKATRDKFGNVVDGSPNSIQRVFYFWGLVQEKQGVVLPDGRPLPPRWVLRDMMWQSVLALV